MVGTSRFILTMYYTHNHRSVSFYTNDRVDISREAGIVRGEGGDISNYKQSTSSDSEMIRVAILVLTISKPTAQIQSSYFSNQKVED